MKSPPTPRPPSAGGRGRQRERGATHGIPVVAPLPFIARYPLPTEETPIEPQQIAAFAAHLADQKRGAQIRLLDVSDSLQVADYFVIITGQSRPQVKAIYQDIHVQLKARGFQHGRAEGGDLGWWVLLDYGSVVVHIMQPEARTYYDIEALYGDAPELDWESIEVPGLPHLTDAPSNPAEGTAH